MDTDAGLPSSFYDGVIETFVITGTVQSDITTIELVADVQEILFELGWALACQEKNKISDWYSMKQSTMATHRQ